MGNLVSAKFLLFGGGCMQELKKEYRLRDNAEFRRVYRHGRSKVSSRAVLYVLPVPGEPTRAGFVTGKKIGGAVQRNRARRLMREVYRRHRDKIADGYHLVFVGRVPMTYANYAQAETEIIRLLRKAKVWRQ